jgi:hypothetical protein
MEGFSRREKRRRILVQYIFPARGTAIIEVMTLGKSLKGLYAWFGGGG